MGQKTNSNILRLGKTKEWESKYFEKKKLEMPQYVFKDLEIKRFIIEFFFKNSLIVNNCKLFYSENSLYIFISFISSSKVFFRINNVSKHQNIKKKLKNRKSKNFNKKIKYLKTKIVKYDNYKKIIVNQTNYLNTEKKLQNKTAKTLYYFYYLEHKLRRLHSINLYKKYFNIIKYRNINHIKSNIFIKNLLESISLFTNKHIDVILNIKQSNKDSNISQTFSKKKKNQCPQI